MKRFHHLLTGLITLAFAFMSTSPVLAQEEGANPQLALSVSQAGPGATIEILGSRFEPDIMVHFLLMRDGTQIRIGSTLADDHGEFLTTALLPYELQPGQYEFQAIDEKNRAATVLLTIILDESVEEEQRTDEDPLLAPMPTYAPGVSVTPMPVVESLESPVTSESSTFPWVPVIAGAGVLFLLFFVIFWRIKRS